VDRTPAPTLRGLVFCRLAEGSATRPGERVKKGADADFGTNELARIKPSFRDFLHPIFDLLASRLARVLHIEDVATMIQLKVY
jgi:hypothetical protein